MTLWPFHLGQRGPKGKHIPRTGRCDLPKTQVSMAVLIPWLAQTSACDCGLFKYRCCLSRLLGLRELTADTQLSWLRGCSTRSNIRPHLNCLLYTFKGAGWDGNVRKGEAEPGEGGWVNMAAEATVEQCWPGCSWFMLKHGLVWLWAVNSLSCLGIPCLRHPDCTSWCLHSWALAGTLSLTLASKYHLRGRRQVFWAMAIAVWKVSDSGRKQQNSSWVSCIGRRGQREGCVSRSEELRLQDKTVKNQRREPINTGGQQLLGITISSCHGLRTQTENAGWILRALIYKPQRETLIFEP